MTPPPSAVAQMWAGGGGADLCSAVHFKCTAGLLTCYPVCAMPWSSTLVGTHTPAGGTASPAVIAASLAPKCNTPSQRPAGLLTSGLLPSMRHALEHLMVTEAPLVVPAALTVMAAPVEVALPSPGGLDMRAALESHRCGGREGGVGGCPRCHGQVVALSHAAYSTARTTNALRLRIAGGGPRTRSPASSTPPPSPCWPSPRRPGTLTWQHPPKPDQSKL